MDFEILHNGKNIEELIEITECYSCDRYGSTLDDLTITFASDTNKVEFNEDDEIEIRTVGGFTTGVMFLDSCQGDNGLFTVRALSFRQKNKRRKSRIWNRVKLSKIISDVAANTGLTPMAYGITDYTYAGVAQMRETGLQLLARLCKREGYTVKCDNGNLIVFNEHYLESNSTPIEITKDSVGKNYLFNRSLNGMSSVTVRHFNADTMEVIAYTSSDDSITGGEDVRIEFLTDINEAQRFSAGYLRDANKYYITGSLAMPFNGSISAGTVANLTGFEEFDGQYVVYEARQDFFHEKTFIKVRRVLAY